MTEVTQQQQHQPPQFSSVQFSSFQSLNSIPISSAKEIIAKARSSFFGALGITQILLLCQDFLNLCLLLCSGFLPYSPPTPKLPGTSKFLLPGPTALQTVLLNHPLPGTILFLSIPHQLQVDQNLSLFTVTKVVLNFYPLRKYLLRFLLVFTPTFPIFDTGSPFLFLWISLGKVFLVNIYH